MAYSYVAEGNSESFGDNIQKSSKLKMDKRDQYHTNTNEMQNALLHICKEFGTIHATSLQTTSSAATAASTSTTAAAAATAATSTSTW